MKSKTFFISVLLVLGGGAVFVLGSLHYSIFPTNRNQTYYWILTIGFFVLTLILKRIRSLSKYSQSVNALFIASAALLFLSTGVLNLHNSAMPPLQNLALDKFSQFLHVVPVLTGLTLLTGGDLKSIFIKRGRFKRSLTFGLISFAGFAVIFILMGFQASGFFNSLGSALPLILLFIFSNAVMEELWFRGIFLKNYENIIGRLPAIIVTSFIFGTAHINATYEFPGGGFVFGLVVFVLGAIGAYSMFKDDSLIGPVLFHAGYDLLIIASVLSSYV